MIDTPLKAPQPIHHLLWVPSLREHNDTIISLDSVESYIPKMPLKILQNKARYQIRQSRALISPDLQSFLLHTIICSMFEVFTLKLQQGVTHGEPDKVKAVGHI